jgi:transcriptional regulator with XRE-family HTH domain
MAITRQKRQVHRELVALRLNAGLSRADLSRRTGVSTESIRLAELGFVPGPHIQFSIARAFEKRPLDLWPLERQRVLS